MLVRLMTVCSISCFRDIFLNKKANLKKYSESYSPQIFSTEKEILRWNPITGRVIQCVISSSQSKICPSRLHYDLERCTTGGVKLNLRRGSHQSNDFKLLPCPCFQLNTVLSKTIHTIVYIILRAIWVLFQLHHYSHTMELAIIRLPGGWIQL